MVKDTKKPVKETKDQTPIVAEAVAKTQPLATEAVSEVTEATVAKTSRKKKVKRNVPHGQVHVLATFNNTIISITDSNGNLLTTSSAGACGFRGSKKGTAYAAQVAAEKPAINAKTTCGLSKADVFVKGIGLGRDSAIRAVSSNGVVVECIKDVTGVPHGGCRPKKARRV